MADRHPVIDDDARLTIDPVSREITSTVEEIHLVQGDHNSERITFEIPKLIDGHDMSLCNRVEIHSINIDKKTKATRKDIYLVDDFTAEDDKVVFSWLVQGNAIPYWGSLRFLITFVCVDDSGNYTYLWHTEFCKLITIGEGSDNVESILDEYPDILQKFKNEILANIAQPDWNQNDSTAADYVKNRPGGYDTVSTRDIFKTMLYNKNGSEDGTYLYKTNGTWSGDGSEPFDFGVSSSVTITVNGTEYKNVPVVDTNGYRQVGDPALTEYPFCFNHPEYMGAGNYAVYHYLNEKLDSFSVSYTVDYLHPVVIPEKYMPTAILRSKNPQISGTFSMNGAIANGGCAVAENLQTIADGYCSHVEGYNTIAKSDYQHVQGKFNIEDTEKKYAHIVGNGTSTKRSNAHTLDWDGNAYFAGNVYVNADKNSANGIKLATEDSVDGKISESEIVVLEAINDLCPCVVEISEGDNGITSTKTFEEINEVINSAGRGEIYAEMLVRDGSVTYHTLKLPLVEHHTTAVVFSAINSGYFEKKYYREVNKLYQEYIETPARFFITITNEDEITITKIPMADRWKITVTESESDSSTAYPDMTARTFQTIMQNAPNMRPYCVYKGDTYEYFSGVFKYFHKENNSIMLKQLAFRNGSNYIDRKVMSYSEIAVSTVDPCVTSYHLGYPGVLYGPGLSEITANPSKYVLAKFEGKFDGAYLTLSELTSTCAMYKRYYTDSDGVFKYDFIKIVTSEGSSENTYGTEIVDAGLPAVTSADAEKVLMVSADGKWKAGYYAQADWDEQNEDANGYIINKPSMTWCKDQNAIVEDDNGCLWFGNTMLSSMSIGDATYFLLERMPYLMMDHMMVLGVDCDDDNLYLTYPKKAEDGTVSIVTTAYPASSFEESSTGTNTSTSTSTST